MVINHHKLGCHPDISLAPEKCGGFLNGKESDQRKCLETPKTQLQETEWLCRNSGFEQHSLRIFLSLIWQYT